MNSLHAHEHRKATVGLAIRPTGRDAAAAGGQTISDPRRLHLGCGNRFIPGFFHIDIAPAEHIDHVGRVDRLPLIADNVVELVYACHVLEHFGRREYRDALSEWHRVLRPGGVLRVAVPDFAACAKIYYEQGLADGLTGLVGLICGGQRNIYDYHKMIFDEPLLTSVLHEIGFREVRRWDWRRTGHAQTDDFSQAHLPHMDKQHGTLMSLNLEAVK